MYSQEGEKKKKKSGSFVSELLMNTKLKERPKDPAKEAGKLNMG